MKRKQNKKHGDGGHIYARDIGYALSDEQLKGIGKVAALWADCDEGMNVVLSRGLRLPPAMWRLIVSGLATNKKMALINGCAKDLLLGQITCDVIGKTVSACGQLSDLRDAILHSSVNFFKQEKRFGTLTSRSGQKYDVLRTKEALNGVADRLSILRDEITEIFRIFQCVLYFYKTDGGSSVSVHTGPTLERVGPLIENLASYQARREALPSMPNFPD